MQTPKQTTQPRFYTEHSRRCAADRKPLADGSGAQCMNYARVGSEFCGTHKPAESTPRSGAECHNAGCYHSQSRRDGVTRNGTPRWKEIPGSRRPLPLTEAQAAKHRAAGHDVREVSR